VGSDSIGIICVGVACFQFLFLVLASRSVVYFAAGLLARGMNRGCIISLHVVIVYMPPLKHIVLSPNHVRACHPILVVTT